MIVLYRSDNSPEGDHVQSRLEDMVAAHRVRPSGDIDLDERELPALQENERIYTGDAIDPFLNRLEAELNRSRLVSADACYVDPDDPSRCV